MVRPPTVEALEPRILLSAEFTETDTLTRPDGVTFDFFGDAMAVEGDLLAVGAYSASFGSDFARGGVSLFDLTTNTFLRELTAPTQVSQDLFGESVATDGTRVLVGARADDDESGGGAIDSGAAYLFDASTGAVLQRFEADTPEFYGQLGWSVALAGNYAVVGAPHRGDFFALSTPETTGAMGSVYVFDTTTGAQLYEISPSDGTAGDMFGWDVFVDGNLLAIGAPGDDQVGNNAGAVYFYDLTNGNLIGKLFAFTPSADAQFGYSIDLDTDVKYLLVGAPGENISEGAAYLYNLVGATGIEVLGKLTGEETVFTDRFGTDVGIDGDRIVIGAPSHQPNDFPFIESGVGFLFETSTLDQIARLRGSERTSGEMAGRTVAIYGSNALVAAPQALASAGRVYVFDADAEPPAIYDFGDAPESYGTLLADDGARHELGGDLYLGFAVDEDADGLPTTDDAFGDNTDGFDEDGITFGLNAENLRMGLSSTITVQASAAGKLSGWFDLDLNGTFDADEKLIADFDVVAGANDVTFDIPLVPGVSVEETISTFARFRVSTQAGLGPTGAAPDGEVEDYTATIRVYDGLVVTNTNDEGRGSLWQAIEYANLKPNDGGPDVITFAIPGDGPHTVSFNGANIMDPLVIDGYTQAGSAVNTDPDAFNGQLMIRLGLDGQGANLSGTDFTLRGLHFLGGLGNGLADGAYTLVGSMVEGSVGATGGSMIGGDAPADRNVLKGGVSVNGDDVEIRNNLIGTDPTGTAAADSDGTGIRISFSDGVLIHGNVISGFNETFAANTAIVITDSLPGSVANVRIENNYIGTDVTGATALANYRGIDVASTNPVEIIGNVIGSTANEAIRLFGGGGSIIQGNYIGVDATGSTSLGLGVGILSSSPNVLIGGPNAGEGNVIAGAAGHAIHLVTGADGTVIQGNTIGADAARENILSNGDIAILIANAFDVLVGAPFETPDLAGAGNFIAGDDILAPSPLSAPIAAITEEELKHPATPGILVCHQEGTTDPLRFYAIGNEWFGVAGVAHCEDTLAGAVPIEYPDPRVPEVAVGVVADGDDASVVVRGDVGEMIVVELFREVGLTDPNAPRGYSLGKQMVVLGSTEESVLFEGADADPVAKQDGRQLYAVITRKNVGTSGDSPVTFLVGEVEPVEAVNDTFFPGSDQIGANEDSVFRGIRDSDGIIVEPANVLNNDIGPGIEVTGLVGGTTSLDGFIGQSEGGATVELLANGDFTYDPRTITDVDQLPQGESIDDRFQYEITAEDGRTDTAFVSIRLFGVNDAPAIDPNQSFDLEFRSVPNDGDPFEVVVGVITATDVDRFDTVTFSSNDANFNVAADGTITLKPNVSIEPGPYQLSVLATDSFGATSEGFVTINRLQLGSIGGKLVYDNNANGVIDANETGEWGNHLVYAVRQSDGATFSDLTDSVGIYEIINLPAGEYEVYVEPFDPESNAEELGILGLALGIGSESTIPSILTSPGGDPRDVTLGLGEVRTGVDFTQAIDLDTIDVNGDNDVPENATAFDGPANYWTGTIHAGDSDWYEFEAAGGITTIWFEQFDCNGNGLNDDFESLTFRILDDLGQEVVGVIESVATEANTILTSVVFETDPLQKFLVEYIAAEYGSGETATCAYAGAYISEDIFEDNNTIPTATPLAPTNGTLEEGLTLTFNDVDYFALPTIGPSTKVVITPGEGNGVIDAFVLRNDGVPLTGVTKVVDPTTGAITISGLPDDEGDLFVEIAMTDPAASRFYDLFFCDNAPPIANDDVFSGVAPGQQIALLENLLDNDTDPDGDALDPTTFLIVEQVSVGTAAYNPINGVLTYEGPSFEGTQSFKYTIADIKGAISEPATVTFTGAPFVSVGIAGIDWETGSTYEVPEIRTLVLEDGVVVGEHVYVSTAGGTFDFELELDEIGKDIKPLLEEELQKTRPDYSYWGKQQFAYAGERGESAQPGVLGHIWEDITGQTMISFDAGDDDQPIYAATIVDADTGVELVTWDFIDCTGGCTETVGFTFNVFLQAGPTMLEVDLGDRTVSGEFQWTEDFSFPLVPQVGYVFNPYVVNIPQGRFTPKFAINGEPSVGQFDLFVFNAGGDVLDQQVINATPELAPTVSTFADDAVGGTIVASTTFEDLHSQSLAVNPYQATAVLRSGDAGDTRFVQVMLGRNGDGSTMYMVDSGGTIAQVDNILLYNPSTGESMDVLPNAAGQSVGQVTTLYFSFYHFMQNGGHEVRAMVDGEAFGGGLVFGGGFDTPVGVVNPNTNLSWMYFLDLSLGADFGDAPASYGDVAHLIDNTMRLGDLIDAEPGMQSTASAIGDDLMGLDDEDGVVFLTPLVPGTTAKVSVTASAPGMLDFWIDWDADGAFDDATGPDTPNDYVGNIVTHVTSGATPTRVEHPGGSVALDAGVNIIEFVVPDTITEGETFARFRLTGAGNVGPTGLAANGEVQDYQVELHRRLSDFGDAPDASVDPAYSYPTVESDGGARHDFDGETLYLGERIDYDTDGQPDADALGDDADDGLSFPANEDPDDEDGVTFGSPLIAGQSAQVNVFATVDPLEVAYLDAWVDFNGDGDWDDPGEQVFDSVEVVFGDNALSIDVPADAVEGDTFARFRLSANGNLDPFGAVAGGEVEDYRVTLIVDDATPEEEVERLRTLVGFYVDAGLLGRGEAVSLTAKLNFKFNGSPSDKGKAKAFTNKIDALIRSGRLTEADAQPLLEGLPSF